MIEKILKKNLDHSLSKTSYIVHGVFLPLLLKNKDLKAIKLFGQSFRAGLDNTTR
ncbi:Hypothetical protein Minf_0580 [Methylacidiphilum infernorum V4]|uniref:Uncharacterized protein n=1 Tax=Methylacidiphilum infernorum (isolate V4) TaxID=481448 RepID=B3DZX7_METI4|nr:Hypothetical protein Minf_0580 [Methylacidiphilum infernorum V4]